MKNLKKILSLVIALAIIMSSFSALAREYLPLYQYMDEVFRFDVGSFAEGGEGSTEVSSEVHLIQLLYTLGVWDDAEKSKDALVSMTEFSIIMSKLRLGAGNAFEGVYANNQNNDKVTYAVALEYIIDALGYYYKCAQYGGSKEGILAVADEIDLISEKPENADAFITRGNLAKIISKALTIDLSVMVTSDNGSYRYEVAEGETLLSEIHNIHIIEGFVNALPGIAVYGDADMKEGKFQIDRKIIESGEMDVSDYLGSFVVAYVKYDEEIEKRDLLYIDYMNAEDIFEVDFSDIVDIDSRTLTYEDADGKEIEIDFDNFEYTTLNGEKINSLQDIDYENNEGKIRFSKSTKYGDIDTALVYQYTYFVVDYIDTREFAIGMKFYQRYKEDGTRVPIVEKAPKRVIIDDQKSDWTKLKSNTVVRFFECASTGYVEIIGLNSAVVGSVTSVYEDYITIKDVEYKISKDMLKHIDYCASNSEISYSDKIRPVEVGTDGTFYIINGIVVCYKSSDSTKTAYLKAVGSTSRSSLDDSVTLRVFTDNAEWLNLVVNDSITLDGDKNASLEDVKTLFKENDFKGSLIKYKANSEGVISYLDTLNRGQNELGNTEVINRVNKDYTIRLNWTYWSLSIGGYFFSTDTKVFTIPENKDKEEDYKVITAKTLPTGIDIVCDVYNVNDFTYMGAIVVNGDVAVEESGAYEAYHIQKITRAMIDTETEELGYKVTATHFIDLRSKANGACREEKFYVSDEDYQAKPFGVGDFLNVSITGGMAIDWGQYTWVRGGVIPEELGTTTFNIGDGNGDQKMHVAEILKIDFANNDVLIKTVDQNGVEIKKMVSPRAKGIMDITRNKTTDATLADFHIGDKVFLAENYGHARYMFKNVR